MKSVTVLNLLKIFKSFGFLFIGWLSLNGYTFSQTQFSLTVGGTDYDIAYSIIQTQDGGYVLGGISTPPGTFDHKMYAVKINSSGSILWSRTVDKRWATSMTQDANGGIVFSSLTFGSFGEGTGICIMELDSSGELQWSGLVPSDGNSPTDIKRTLDGGFLLTGSTSKLFSDAYIAKFDSSKYLEWAKSIGGGNIDACYSITESTNGGCAAAGITVSFAQGPSDMYIVKLDSSGQLQWNRAIGGPGGDYAHSITNTSDGGYAVAGVTWSFGGGDTNMYIVKLNEAGTLQWNRTVGGTRLDYANSIIQTQDGGYAIGGYTESFGTGSGDMYIIKLDSSGTLQWSRTIGGAGIDIANSIIQTTDGGYALAGYTFSFGEGNTDMYFVKLDASGNSCGYSTSPVSIITQPASLVTAPAPSVTDAVTGLSNPLSISRTGGTSTNLCLVGIKPGLNEIPDEFRLYQNYPNPFNPTTKIQYDLHKASFVKLVIYDAIGRKIKTLVNREQTAGSYYVNFDSENLSSGIYFYKLEAGSFTESKKMLLAR